MKNITTVLLAILFASTIFAQTGVVISENSGETPDNSAILDVRSTTQGILIPRMTVHNRINMPNKTEGLMVYQTDDVSGFYYYDGSEWQLMIYFKDDGSQIIVDAGTGIEGADGKSIKIKAQDANSDANPHNGGDIVLTPSNGYGVDGEAGNVILDGNVGIGTAVPTSLLHLESDEPTITLTESTIANYKILVDGGGMQIGPESSSNRSVCFNNLGSGDVNVGIGTDNPDAKLSILGNGGFLRVKNKTTGNIAFYVGESSNHPWLGLYNSNEIGTIVFNTNGTSFFNSGNLGVGTDIAKKSLRRNNNNKLEK